LAYQRQDGNHLMADIADVEQGFVNEISSTLYPRGLSEASLLGVTCRIYRGWPNSATLNSDLAAGVVNVTLTSDNEHSRTTTRYLPEYESVTPIPGTTISVTGAVITIGGTPGVGDVVGVLIGGSPYVYRIATGDTAAQVASNLSQAIQADKMVVLSGTAITLYDTPTIIGRAVCDASTSFESRRQEKDVRIICWCPNPTIRDAVAAAIDEQLDQLPFLKLPDSSSARVTYRNTSSYDQAQNALLYRRDLIYSVEYATITTLEQATMLFGKSDINAIITYG
jgi:hypothetical protein